jgi:hypothetical protein
MPVFLATLEAEIWRILVQGQSRQIILKTVISKITRAEWVGGVDEIVVHLLCKHKRPNSNPSPTKKNYIYNVEVFLKCT